MINLQKRLHAALEEDIASGDVTSEALIPAESRSEAFFLAKQAGILCGLPFALEVFRLLDPQIVAHPLQEEGAVLHPGEYIARLEGRTRALLSGERTALNLLSHLSGIATMTAQLCELIRGSKTRILDTRKTMPLWRDLEKYAVRTGGGSNHRFGLYDMVLIKDNHVTACGGIGLALAKARSGIRPGLKVEIEVQSVAQFEEALAAGADWIMLDNMTPADMALCVTRAAGRVLLEASGGVRAANLAEVAASGVDFVSLGALTHSAPALDISLEIVQNISSVAAERAV